MQMLTQMWENADAVRNMRMIFIFMYFFLLDGGLSSRVDLLMGPVIDDEAPALVLSRLYPEEKC